MIALNTYNTEEPIVLIAIDLVDFDIPEMPRKQVLNAAYFAILLNDNPKHTQLENLQVDTRKTWQAVKKWWQVDRDTKIKIYKLNDIMPIHSSLEEIKPPINYFNVYFNIRVPHTQRGGGGCGSIKLYYKWETRGIKLSCFFYIQTEIMNIYTQKSQLDHTYNIGFKHGPLE